MQDEVQSGSPRHPQPPQTGSMRALTRVLMGIILFAALTIQIVVQNTTSSLQAFFEPFGPNHRATRLSAPWIPTLNVCLLDVAVPAAVAGLWLLISRVCPFGPRCSVGQVVSALFTLSAVAVALITAHCADVLFRRVRFLAWTLADLAPPEAQLPGTVALWVLVGAVYDYRVGLPFLAMVVCYREMRDGTVGEIVADLVGAFVFVVCLQSLLVPR